jgi:iron complex transport system substrate-binding protein
MATTNSDQLRVLSLLSASTEIVCRLGCAHLLVGRSHGCDDPPLATALPVATAPRVDPNASSKEIDKAVRAQSVAGGPIYHIHSALVTDLRPDVILTQEQCRICAVTPEDVNRACESLPMTKLVTIKPVTLDDVMGDVQCIADALGVHERGTRLVALMRARIAALSDIAPRTSPPLRVAHIEWLAPLMGSGYWIAECVEAANCTMVHGSRGGHSTTLESLRALSNADVILLAPCGFSIERTNAELSALGLLEADAWKELPAVRRGAVAVADGNLYFNRSSTGVVETAEIVAEVAHPEVAGLLGHHGRRWVRLAELAAFCARAGAPPPTKPVKVAPVDVESDGGGKRAKLAPSSGTNAGPAAHVRRQVELLRSRDFEGAFAINSAANRARIGGIAKFQGLVETNPLFAALADPANECACLEAGRSDGRCTVEVRLTVQTASQGTLVFGFDVSNDSPEVGCATEGVRIVC